MKEFNRNERVWLAQVYSPEQMQALRRAQKALEPLAQRSGQATTGSITAENSDLPWKVLRVGLNPLYGALRAGGIVARVKDSFGLVFGNDNVAQANELVKRMMFDPDLAAHLLTRDPKAGGPAWNAKLQKLIAGGEAVRTIDDTLGGDD